MDIVLIVRCMIAGAIISQRGSVWGSVDDGDEAKKNLREE